MQGDKSDDGPLIQFGHRLWTPFQRRNIREILGNIKLATPSRMSALMWQFLDPPVTEWEENYNGR